MAQKKTTKKATAKRTTAAHTTKRNTTITGSTNLKTKPKWMNWKVILPLIVIVAAFGGYYYVKQSEASGYSFIRNANQMQGGQLVRKSNGATFRQARYNERIHTIVHSDELNTRRTNRVCAFVKNISSDTRTVPTFRLYQQVPGSASIRALANAQIRSGQTVQICSSNFLRISSGIGVRTANTASFQVHSIRGIR